MRRIALPVLAGVAVLGAAACSADSQDFKKAAENFIDDDDDVSSEVGEEINDVECEEPTSKDVGTTYTCTGTGESGTAYEFGVEITGERELQVVRAEVVGGATAGSTPVASSAPAGPNTTG